ncbi:MAG: helix-turn-helix domain-containing protein [Verrucomicrobium sp.]|nr:helix-turn-helix domain-containing protein [Verrucomicrobium sp.]
MPPSLGHQLRLAREARNLTLADLAHETRIPEARLADLENDTYDQFGGAAYARMFLRTYAHRLEVNAEAELEQFDHPFAVPSKSSPATGRRFRAWRIPELGFRWGMGAASEGSAAARSRSKLRSRVPASAAPRSSRPPRAVATPPRENLGNSFKVTVVVCAATLILGAGFLIAQAYQQQHSPSAASAAQPVPPTSAETDLEVEVRRAEPVPETRAMENLPQPPKAVPVRDKRPPTKAVLVK